MVPRILLVSIGLLIQVQTYAGSVFVRAEKLDLALLRLTDPYMGRWCDLTTGVPLRTLETLATNRNALTLILQRVPSTAGGIDRASMRLQSADANSPWITLLPDSENDRIFQGDSGSSIWSESRYSNRSGESRGEMIGMVTSTEGESIRVLRSDHIYLSVHAMLWPLKESLEFEPQNVTLFEMIRGALCCDCVFRPNAQFPGMHS